MKAPRLAILAAFPLLLITLSANGQTFPTDDVVIKKMWEEGIVKSQTSQLAHELIDVVGPRLSGSSSLAEAQDWVLGKYASWGVKAEKEQYGTWLGWEQGILHVDMLEPRVATLETEMLAWSPGTDGPVEGDVVVPPADLDESNAAEWLSSVKGKFVLLSPPELMCRARQELETYARPETIERLNESRRNSSTSFAQRLQAIGGMRGSAAKVDSAGAAGILTSRWSGGWGVNKVFSTRNKNAIGIDVSCEDYGLLYRLTESGNTPKLRVDGQARFTGTVPQFNVVGQIEGSEKPDEFVLLGAHLDSWHAATGATDNGTGSITMLEAMRILKTAYPNPKRTIVVGHWGGEEQGTIGSSAFREDHPEVMSGLQVAFNQDNGTWRFEKIEGQGMLEVAGHLPQWMSFLPTELSSTILLELPGAQNNQGSDHTSFLCAKLPSLRLQSPYDEYRQYTWHTNRDTYDKIVFDDLAQNATVAAMLAYRASEDPEKVGRSTAILPTNPRTGRARTWRECRPARREFR
ncbi:MAG: M20/M25/M40 family metallo-hydrolase [Rhodothermales bacterium]|nr:M20/M25/M40 family metallo-hydrolase [Rhodothermales bacterium]